MASHIIAQLDRASERASSTMLDDYCLLVSSCDAYEDCWLPFFTLFARYWPSPTRLIYLNTETKHFTYRGLPLMCPAPGQPSSTRLPWSARLLRCLDVIPYRYVLYLQEDYFLTDAVDVPRIDAFVDLMRRHGISHIGLERGLTGPSGPKSEHRFLSYVGPRADYRISAQAGLWDVAALRSYLRRHETVWEFEWYGTRRAWRKHDTFLYVDREYEQTFGKKVFPYVPTGVVQGRWVREVVQDLFATHGIEIDYRVRGFHDESPLPPRPHVVRRAIRRVRSIR
jgi:hypothetical protein